jgi:hypothetical protein
MQFTDSVQWSEKNSSRVYNVERLEIQCCKQTSLDTASNDIYITQHETDTGPTRVAGILQTCIWEVQISARTLTMMTWVYHGLSTQMLAYTFTPGATNSFQVLSSLSPTI